MDKAKKNKIADICTEILRWGMFGGLSIFSVLMLIGTAQDKKKQEQIDAKVKEYRAKLPNYADSLDAHISANSGHTVQWSDAIRDLPAGAARDAAAAKYGYYIAKCGEYADKKAQVDMQVMQYRDSLKNVR